MNARMYVCMYVHMYACMHACMYNYVYACVYTYTEASNLCILTKSIQYKIFIGLRYMDMYVLYCHFVVHRLHMLKFCFVNACHDTYCW